MRKRYANAGGHSDVATGVSSEGHHGVGAGVGGKVVLMTVETVVEVMTVVVVLTHTPHVAGHSVRVDSFSHCRSVLAVIQAQISTSRTPLQCPHIIISRGDVLPPRMHCIRPELHPHPGVLEHSSAQRTSTHRSGVVVVDDVREDVVVVVSVVVELVGQSAVSSYTPSAQSYPSTTIVYASPGTKSPAVAVSKECLERTQKGVCVLAHVRILATNKGCKSSRFK